MFDGIEIRGEDGKIEFCRPGEELPEEIPVEHDTSAFVPSRPRRKMDFSRSRRDWKKVRARVINIIRPKKRGERITLVCQTLPDKRRGIGVWEFKVARGRRTIFRHGDEIIISKGRYSNGRFVPSGSIRHAT